MLCLQMGERISEGSGISFNIDSGFLSTSCTAYMHFVLNFKGLSSCYSIPLKKAPAGPGENDPASYMSLRQREGS